MSSVVAALYGIDVCVFFVATFLCAIGFVSDRFSAAASPRLGSSRRKQ